MEGTRLLRSITLKNILSFGPEGQTLDFEPLNVLIGPNGSGKSNLIEIIGLMRALPKDLGVPLREGGGITEWCWKGNDPIRSIYIESTLGVGEGPDFKHQIEIEADGYTARVVEERMRGIHREIVYDPDGRVFPDDQQQTSHFYYVNNSYKAKPFKSGQSLLAQQTSVPEVQGVASFLAEMLSGIQMFRKWVFGPGSKIRDPQKADLPSDFLTEDTLNLGLVLNSLILDRRAKSSLLKNLKDIYVGVTDIRVRVVAGYLEIMIEEENGCLIPAARLSDGTLRYLCLLAIFCHPDPPPLICIEEPELGLHPDIIPTIARLLIDASQRTQLIVTTHSADLISALWEFPESVVVCECEVYGTTMRRLNADQLKEWLDDYSLGDLWRSGEIGGNRW